MKHTDGHYFILANGNGGVHVQMIHGEFRSTGIMLIAKHIAHVADDGCGHIRFCPNIDGMKIAKRAQIIESRHMIEMFVGEQHGFNARHGIIKPWCFVESQFTRLFIAHFIHFAHRIGNGSAFRVRMFCHKSQHLPPKIWSTINENQSLVVCFDQSRTAQSFVSGIL